MAWNGGTIYIRRAKDSSYSPIWHDGTNVYVAGDFALASKVESTKTHTNGMLIDIDGTATNGLYIDNDGTVSGYGVKLDGVFGTAAIGILGATGGKITSTVTAETASDPGRQMYLPCLWQGCCKTLGQHRIQRHPNLLLQNGRRKRRQKSSQKAKGSEQATLARTLPWSGPFQSANQVLKCKP